MPTSRESPWETAGPSAKSAGAYALKTKLVVGLQREESTEHGSAAV